MNTIGIICEYNPFHNGHKYHINKVKELFPNSLIILIISGYFTQRGDISILTKEDKTKIALNNNVDLVIELPFLYGSQSADTFSKSAIYLLNKLHINYLVFGSESNDINLLEDIVNIQLYDTNYNKKVKEYLDQGLNYPTAMAKSLNLDKNINNPNDLLGISYIKAIKEFNYNIKPITIKRTNDYNDLESSENIISANNIRNKLKNNEEISNYLNKEVIDVLKNVDEDKYFELLKYKIISDNDLSKYLTVDEGIDKKLKKVINECNSLEELLNKIKTKRYTYNKLNRMFIHILIGILKSDNVFEIDYLKILGFNKQGKKYLNEIKKDLDISLNINHNSKVFEYELKASLIYDLLTNSNTYEYEIKNKPIIL